MDIAVLSTCKELHAMLLASTQAGSCGFGAAGKHAYVHAQRAMTLSIE